MKLTPQQIENFHREGWLFGVYLVLAGIERFVIEFFRAKDDRLAFGLTIVISFVAGVIIERVIIRPVENAPVLSVVTVFVALLVILNSVAGWIYTYTIKTFPSPFPAAPPFGNQFISSHELGTIGITLVMLVLLSSALTLALPV